MHHVDPMREQVRHRAAAKIPVPAPQIKFVFAERLVRRSAEPLFPIQQLRVNWIAAFPRVVVLPPVRPHLRHSPQASAVNQRCCIPHCRIFLLLRTALMSAAPSSIVCVTGFSKYTSLPALTASTAMCTCQ